MTECIDITRCPSEKLFLSLALAFGIVFVFVTPPIQVADEDSHYKRAYALSIGKLVPDVLRDSTTMRVGHYLPHGILEFEASHRYMIGKQNAKYRYSDLYYLSAASANYGENVFDTYSAATLNPIIYLPQAAGMLFGRFLYAIGFASKLYSPAANLYFGRVFNLLFYVACFYWAISFTPVLKNAFLVCGLLPMSMNLASSLSRDAAVIGVAFLFVAYVLHLATHGSGTIGRKQVLYLTLMGIVLILSKQVYFSLTAMLLIIPATTWGSVRRRWHLIGIIVGICVLIYMADQLVLTVLMRGNSGSIDSPAKLQAIFVAQHPVDYLKILFRSLTGGGVGYLVGLVGNLGWLDTNFPYPFIALSALLLMLTSILDQDVPGGLDRNGKLLAATVLLGVVAFLETAFYILWTSLPSEGGIGAPVITGVQGRYFLPLLPLGLLIVRNRFTVRWTKATAALEMLLPPLLVAIQVYSLFILIIRYWIPQYAS